MLLCKSLQKLIINHLHSLNLCMWENCLDKLYVNDRKIDCPDMHSNTSIYFHHLRFKTLATYFAYVTNVALHAMPLNKHPTGK